MLHFSPASTLARLARIGDKVVLWLLLHPLIAAFCVIQARRNGIWCKPWGLAGLVLGPLVLPLWFNHRRMRWRAAIGRGSIWFRP